MSDSGELPNGLLFDLALTPHHLPPKAEWVDSGVVAVTPGRSVKTWAHNLWEGVKGGWTGFRKWYGGLGQPEDSTGGPEYHQDRRLGPPGKASKVFGDTQRVGWRTMDRQEEH